MVNKSKKKSYERHLFLEAVWATSSEIVPSSKRSVRTRIILHMRKSHPGICSPLKHSKVSNNSVCGQLRPRSDYTDAQADLGLRCPHMPEDTFSYSAAHIKMLTPSMLGKKKKNK